jgi:hypothetical protein
MVTWVDAVVLFLLTVIASLLGPTKLLCTCVPGCCSFFCGGCMQKWSSGWCCEAVLADGQCFFAGANQTVVHLRSWLLQFLLWGLHAKMVIWVVLWCCSRPCRA